MHHSSSKKTGGGAVSAAEKAERRASLRYDVTATAEVTELDSGVRLAARTNDLSEGGCFIYTLAPLPAESQIRVHLGKGQEVFEAVGRVVYSQQGLGMGIAFTKVDPKQKALLDSWLAQISAGSPVGVETAEAASVAQKTPSAERTPEINLTFAVRLVRLLVARGILTEEDGASLLREALL